MKVALLPLITQEERDAQRRAEEFARLVWITCRVCGLRSKVSLDNPALLCGPCRVDVNLTRGHVLHLRDAYRARLVDATAIWEGAMAKAGADAQARWQKVEAARVALAEGRVDLAAFQATWRRARAAGGAFALLLSAYETFEQTSEECNAALERTESALREIAAYEDTAALSAPVPRAPGADDTKDAT